MEAADPAAVTRGEAARTVAGMLALEQQMEAGEPYYTDVPADHAAYGAVAALCDRGIISGEEARLNRSRAVTANRNCKKC